jgi:hypothetical protein
MANFGDLPERAVTLRLAVLGDERSVGALWEAMDSEGFRDNLVTKSVSGHRRE